MLKLLGLLKPLAGVFKILGSGLFGYWAGRRAAKQQQKLDAAEALNEAYKRRREIEKSTRDLSDDDIRRSDNW